MPSSSQHHSQLSLSPTPAPSLAPPSDPDGLPSLSCRLILPGFCAPFWIFWAIASLLNLNYQRASTFHYPQSYWKHYLLLISLLSLGYNGIIPILPCQWGLRTRGKNNSTAIQHHNINQFLNSLLNTKKTVACFPFLPTNTLPFHLPPYNLQLTIANFIAFTLISATMNKSSIVCP